MGGLQVALASGTGVLGIPALPLLSNCEQVPKTSLGLSFTLCKMGIMSGTNTWGKQADGAQIRAPKSVAFLLFSTIEQMGIRNRLF